MGKQNDLTITVNAQLQIPKETAERCMRILEMYLRDNPHLVMLDGGEKPDRSDFRLWIEQRGD